MKGPRRLELGLTDVERRERDHHRRTRNCFVLLAVLALLAGMLDKYFQ